MGNFKRIFSDYGYQLFEESSIENAIVQAIKSNEIRYILGIPLIIEKADINYENLIEKAKKEKFLDRLLEILFISSKIIKNKEKQQLLKKIIAKKRIKKQFDEDEFKQIYEQYSQVNERLAGFPSQLHYQLSFIFAKKQIQILYKIKTGERLKKTEKEYYSRTIKKRLIAIRELSQFARDLLVKE